MRLLFLLKVPDYTIWNILGCGREKKQKLTEPPSISHVYPYPLATISYRAPSNFKGADT